jgi:hypothetical protein
MTIMWRESARRLSYERTAHPAPARLSVTTLTAYHVIGLNVSQVISRIESPMCALLLQRAEL